MVQSLNTNTTKIVICTGGFDPIHEGHIAYLEAARKIGDYLVVGVNSDDWLKRKKGYVFQNFYTRSTIVDALKPVDLVLSFDDSDNSARDAIIKTQRLYGKNLHYIFANGGDRTKENIPEMDVPNVDFVFGVGGENKLNSSSWIVNGVRNVRDEV